LGVSQRGDLFRQEGRDVTDPLGDVADPFRTVVNGIESCHGSQQRLCGADVGSGLLAFYVLFAGLQRHAQGPVAVDIFGDADDAAWEDPLVFVTGGEKGGMRTAVAHGNAETLAASADHVGAPFPGRGQQGKTHQVGSHSHADLSGMGSGHKPAIIADLPVGIGILDQASEDIVAEIKFRSFLHAQDNPLRPCTRDEHVEGLGPYLLVDEEAVDAVLHHLTASGGKQHRHGLGSGCGFVKEGGIGNLHTGKVTHHGLEIEQGLEPSLRNLSLVRGV